MSASDSPSLSLSLSFSLNFLLYFLQRIKRAILVAHNVSGGTDKKEAMNKLTDKDRENIKGECGYI